MLYLYICKIFLNVEINENLKNEHRQLTRDQTLMIPAECPMLSLLVSTSLFIKQQHQVINDFIAFLS